MTAARNRLNKAQKAIDDWYATAKKEAPTDTDWQRAERIGRAVGDDPRMCVEPQLITSPG